MKRFRRSSRSAFASVADADVEETRGRRRIVVDEFTRSVIRRQVHSFFAHCKHSTVEKVFARCKEEIPDLPDMRKTTSLENPEVLVHRFPVCEDQGQHEADDGAE